MRQSRGFTLVELLVVLFVISLIIGMALFSMGVFKSSHNLENTTQALSSRLHLAQMEALFEQESLGVAIDENGYQFYRKQSPDTAWELITDDSLFKPQDFPDHTKMELTINGKAQESSTGVPQLIVQQGLLSPFEITFQDDENHSFQIGLSEQGEVVWTPL